MYMLPLELQYFRRTPSGRPKVLKTTFLYLHINRFTQEDDLLERHEDDGCWVAPFSLWVTTVVATAVIFALHPNIKTLFDTLLPLMCQVLCVARK